MSERINQCHLCKSTDVAVVMIHNPDTQDLNSMATLKCNHCNNEWLGRVTSPWTEKQRRDGFLI